MNKTHVYKVFKMPDLTQRLFFICSPLASMLKRLLKYRNKKEREISRVELGTKRDTAQKQKD